MIAFSSLSPTKRQHPQNPESKKKAVSATNQNKGNSSDLFSQSANNFTNVHMITLTHVNPLGNVLTKIMSYLSDG